jgi:hypothetical protein
MGSEILASIVTLTEATIPYTLKRLGTDAQKLAYLQVSQEVLALLKTSSSLDEAKDSLLLLKVGMMEMRDRLFSHGSKGAGILPIDQALEAILSMQKRFDIDYDLTKIAREVAIATGRLT